MGCYSYSPFVIIILLCSSLILVDASDHSHDPNSLDYFFISLAGRISLLTHPTGTPYQIPLPSNFSGMDLSVIKLRTNTLWQQGANLSSLGNISISVPPKILPWPFVDRVIILSDNLGNWSAEYYRVPGFSLVAPVVGFNLYDASNLSALGSQNLAFGLMGDPISIGFGSVVNQSQRNATAPFQCVRFGDGGVVELKNMTGQNVCQTNSPGRLSVVVPSEKPREEPEKEKEKKGIRISLVGLVVGIVGLVLLMVLVGCLIWWCAWTRRTKKMEKESEKDAAFETFWVGQNKMPTASMTRTQPVIEHDDVP